MKKLISTLSFIFLLGVAAVPAQQNKVATASNVTKSKVSQVETQKSREVKAYYFHLTRRCVTCEAVEAVTKEAIKEYYGDKVTFQSINSEEENDNPLVAKYKISGTSLLIVNGDKTVDLTNDAFLNATRKPDKLKSLLKSTIDSMM